MQKGSTVKVWNSKQLPTDWLKRQQVDQAATQELEANVKAIINQVKTDGDKALLSFALKFDKAELNPRTLQVRGAEIKEAYMKIGRDQIVALQVMQKKVSVFQKQLLTPVSY